MYLGYFVNDEGGGVATQVVLRQVTDQARLSPVKLQDLQQKPYSFTPT